MFLRNPLQELTWGDKGGKKLQLHSSRNKSATSNCKGSFHPWRSRRDLYSRILHELLLGKGVYRCQGLLYPAAAVASHFLQSIDTNRGFCL